MFSGLGTTHPSSHSCLRFQCPKRSESAKQMPLFLSLDVVLSGLFKIRLLQGQRRLYVQFFNPSRTSGGGSRFQVLQHHIIHIHKKTATPHCGRGLNAREETIVYKITYSIWRRSEKGRSPRCGKCKTCRRSLLMVNFPGGKIKCRRLLLRVGGDQGHLSPDHLHCGEVLRSMKYAIIGGDMNPHRDT